VGLNVDLASKAKVSVQGPDGKPTVKTTSTAEIMLQNGQKVTVTVTLTETKSGRTHTIAEVKMQVRSGEVVTAKIFDSAKRGPISSMVAKQGKGTIVERLTKLSEMKLPAGQAQQQKVEQITDAGGFRQVKVMSNTPKTEAKVPTMPQDLTSPTEAVRSESGAGDLGGKNETSNTTDTGAETYETEMPDEIREGPGGIQDVRPAASDQGRKTGVGKAGGETTTKVTQSDKSAPGVSKSASGGKATAGGSPSSYSPKTDSIGGTTEGVSGAPVVSSEKSTPSGKEMPVLMPRVGITPAAAGPKTIAGELAIKTEKGAGEGTETITASEETASVEGEGQVSGEGITRAEPTRISIAGVAGAVVPLAKQLMKKLGVLTDTQAVEIKDAEDISAGMATVAVPSVMGKGLERHVQGIAYDAMSKVTETEGEEGWTPDVKVDAQGKITGDAKLTIPKGDPSIVRITTEEGSEMKIELPSFVDPSEVRIKLLDGGKIISTGDGSVTILDSKSELVCAGTLITDGGELINQEVSLNIPKGTVVDARGIKEKVLATAKARENVKKQAYAEELGKTFDQVKDFTVGQLAKAVGQKRQEKHAAGVKQRVEAGLRQGLATKADIDPSVAQGMTTGELKEAVAQKEEKALAAKEEKALAAAPTPEAKKTPAPQQPAKKDFAGMMAAARKTRKEQGIKADAARLMNAGLSGDQKATKADELTLDQAVATVAQALGISKDDVMNADTKTLRVAVTQKVTQKASETRIAAVKQRITPLKTEEPAPQVASGEQVASAPKATPKANDAKVSKVPKVVPRTGDQTTNDMPETVRLPDGRRTFLAQMLPVENKKDLAQPEAQKRKSEKALIAIYEKVEAGKVNELNRSEFEALVSALQNADNVGMKLYIDEIFCGIAESCNEKTAIALTKFLFEKIDNKRDAVLTKYALEFASYVTLTPRFKDASNRNFAKIAISLIDSSKVSQHKSLEVRLQVVRTLTNCIRFCCGDDRNSNLNFIKESGAIPILKTLLNDNREEISEMTSFAIEGILQELPSSSSTSKIVKEFLPGLVTVIRSGSKKGKTYAMKATAVAIKLLENDPAAWELIKEEGLVEAIEAVATDVDNHKDIINLANEILASCQKIAPAPQPEGGDVRVDIQGKIVGRAIMTIPKGDESVVRIRTESGSEMRIKPSFVDPSNIDVLVKEGGKIITTGDGKVVVLDTNEKVVVEGTLITEAGTLVNENIELTVPKGAVYNARSFNRAAKAQDVVAEKPKPEVATKIAEHVATLKSNNATPEAKVEAGRALKKLVNSNNPKVAIPAMQALMAIASDKEASPKSRSEATRAVIGAASERTTNH